jgi:hypothetical protein
MPRAYDTITPFACRGDNSIRLRDKGEEHQRDPVASSTLYADDRSMWVLDSMTAKISAV